MRLRSRLDATRALLLLGGLAASVLMVRTATRLGDYPTDGGPALTALLHGDLYAFSAAKPAMGVLSLLVRLPFAAVADLGSPTELSVYRWGALPCVASMAVLGVWLAGIARTRGTPLTGQIAVVALAVFNPYVESALRFGHPEELLTTSLAIGAVVAAAQRRGLLTVVLLGLALACKQWAVIPAFLVIAIARPHRLRTLAGSATIAAIVSLPAVIGSPSAFLRSQLDLVHEQYLIPHMYSWLFPFAPVVPHRALGGFVDRQAELPATLVGLVHPVILGAALLIAVQLARLAGPYVTLDHLFAAFALAFLLRCTLDTETITYYHAPLFATLLAWDVMKGERIPYRAIGAAIGGYALFDRLTINVISPNLASWLYAGVTLIAAFALARALTSRRTRAPADATSVRSARAQPGLQPLV